MPLPPHAREWMNRAEIDYIGPFVKAWAAFNAWYRITSGRDAERAMLDFIVRDMNSALRRRTLPILDHQNETADAQALKQATCDLQLKLDAIQFEVNRKGNRERVSLRTVCIRPIANWQGDHVDRYGQRFAAAKVQGGGGQIEISVTSIRTGQRKFRYVQPRYDANDVYAQPDFTNNLNDSQRIALRQFYDSCNPRPMVDLVQGGGPLLVAGTLQLQCTPEDLLAGLVETIYTMRNALLHGEVDPDPQVLACYEPAYRIVMHFLKSIQ